MIFHMHTTGFRACVHCDDDCVSMVINLVAGICSSTHPLCYFMCPLGSRQRPFNAILSLAARASRA